MGGGTPSNTTQTTKTELPPWLNQAAQENIALARQLGSQPYQPYTGQLVAGTDPLQQQAYNAAGAGTGWSGRMDAARTALNQAQYRTGVAGNAPANTAQAASAGNAPLMQAASAGNAPLAQAAGNVRANTFADADLSAYMNPYTQQVVDTSLGALDRQRQQALVQNAGAAAAAGAFGGGRHGVVESLTNEAALQQSGQLAAQLNSAGFTQAQAAIAADQARQQQAAQFNAGNQQQVNLANQAAQLSQGQFNAGNLQQAGLANQAAQLSQGQFNAGNLQQTNLFNANAQEAMRQRQLQAAGQTGQLGQAQSQLGALQSALRTSDINLWNQLGNQRQDNSQFALDKAYEQYLRQQQYPIDMLNLQVGATAQTPYGSTVNQSQPLTRNRTAGALGGAASGAAAGTAIMPGWGTAIGALVGGGLGYFGS